MAHTHVQSFKKNPYLTPEFTKEHNGKPQRQLKERLPITNDTDSNGEGTREEEQAEEAGPGGED